MRNATMKLCLCLLVLAGIGLPALAQQGADLKIDVFIPPGMEQLIQVEIVRDDKEPSITKLSVKRTVSPDVRFATFFQTMIGPNSQRPSGDFVTKIHVDSFTTDKVSDPASVAWASSERIERFVLVVESVETDTGTWVLDIAPEQKAKIYGQIVEYGSVAVPRAKFVPKQ